MSYLDGVPTYVYPLPCGHDFRSRTESQPDDDGAHWFYCERCSCYFAIPASKLCDGRPMYPSGKKRMGDHQMSVQTDSAIVRDRVAAFYRSVWDDMSIRQVAKILEVSQDHVEHVALDLGVYESDPHDIGDRYR